MKEPPLGAKLFVGGEHFVSLGLLVLCLLLLAVRFSVCFYRSVCFCFYICLAALAHNRCVID